MQILSGHRLRTAKDETGQVFALVAISMVALCAVAGFAVDAGTWYQAHRKQQAITDASALAAVRNLPGNQGQATADAQSYATKNGGSLPPGNIAYSTKYRSGDTVTVTSSTTVPSYFLKVIGINSATATATSVATAENLQSAQGAMPFGVINTQPELSGAGCPCFNVATTLTVSKVGAPGGFGIVNIDGSSGPASPGTIAGWITNGCNCATNAPQWYGGTPGARFNSSQVQTAMNGAIGKTLLFPVYDSVTGNGANISFHVIGWSAFTITSWSGRGSSATISGYFVKADWTGTATTSIANYFGVTTSILTG
jgi:Flp pilus assembly protein TadG